MAKIPTTIRIREATYERLAALKQHPRETMDDVLARLLQEVTEKKARKP